MVPELDEKELVKMVNPIVKEYFQHGDTKEVQVRSASRPRLDDTLAPMRRCLYST